MPGSCGYMYYLLHIIEHITATLKPNKADHYVGKTKARVMWVHVLSAAYY